MRARHVQRRVADSDGALAAASCRLAYARGRRARCGSRRSQPNAPCPRGKSSASPSRSIRACATAGGLPVKQRAVLDCCGRLRGMRGELPVARVGRREEANVVIGERLAPARQAGVDLRFGNTRRYEVRGGCAPGRCHQGRRALRRRSRTRLRAPAGSPPRIPRRASAATSRRRRTARARSGRHHRVDSLAQRADVLAAERSGPSSATSTAREPTTMPSASSAAAARLLGRRDPEARRRAARR